MASLNASRALLVPSRAFLLLTSLSPPLRSVPLPCCRCAADTLSSPLPTRCCRRHSSGEPGNGVVRRPSSERRLQRAEPSGGHRLMRRARVRPHTQ
eukprot:6191962-Pleurochrysis_carterae.AAC.4